MVFEHYTMQSLAEFLTKVRGMDRPVVDQTGEPGEYDFTVEVLESPTGDGADAKRAMERATTDPSFGALVAGQIGLKLEPRSSPLELLVIDRLERATEN